MALNRITQTINGKKQNTLVLECSAADLSALTALLEGAFAVSESYATGGTVASAPDKFNRQTYKVLKSNKVHGRETGVSTQFTITHLNPAKDSSDVFSAVAGVFDCSYTSSVKCDVVSLKYDRR